MEEDANHILSKYPEIKKGKEEFICSKLLNVNEDIACKKTMNCTNVIKL
jgi:hypothetical protein